MPPQFSVVVAAVDAGRTIVPCLRALEADRRSSVAEVIVADASSDDTPALVARDFPGIVLLRYPTGTLTPVLWAHGAARAHGSIVAFTTGHCVPRPGWLRALEAAMNGGAAAAGGPLVLAARTTLLDWAVFYLRYSAFTPATIGPAGRTSGEIAGDNAAYRHDVLERHAALVADGFWEVEVHKALRADDQRIVVAPGALVEFGPSFRLRTILRHRFAHGRHFGAGRVRAGTRRTWQMLAAAPLVPMLMALRAGRRLFRLPEHRWRFLLSLPAFLTIAAAWAAGEAAGAALTVVGRNDSHRRA